MKGLGDHAADLAGGPGDSYEGAGLGPPSAGGGGRVAGRVCRTHVSGVSGPAAAVGLVGGSDNAGGVEQGGGDDLGVKVEQREELLVFLGHAPADDEKVGGEEHFDVAVVALEALGPLLPGQALGFTLPGGGARLGVMPVNLQVAELGVGYQGPSTKIGRASCRERV